MLFRSGERASIYELSAFRRPTVNKDINRERTGTDLVPDDQRDFFETQRDAVECIFGAA